MTHASTRLAFSLYFCNQFNSILAQVDDCLPPGSTVHQQPAQSTEGVWTTYLDTHDDFLWWLQRATVHSRRPHSRQDQAQSISNNCQSNYEKYEFNQSSKYFKICPSQSWNIENFGGGSIDCPKITEDKSSESRVQTPDTRLIIATGAAPRCEDRNSLPFTVMTETQSLKAASQHHCSTKMQSLKAASQHHCSTKARVETCVSASLQ